MQKSISRRRVLQTGAAAAAATASSMPFIHGAYAAGSLNVAFWDHWVPGANDTMTKLCKAWADKEKVDIKIDYVTSQGDKLMLTAAAEAQARSGHDMITLPVWYAAAQTDALENSDDVWATLIKQYGEPSAGHVYVGKQKGHWIAPPAIPNSLTLPSVGRIDLFKQYAGLDLTQMYPAQQPANKELTDKWTLDFFLEAAEKCFKGGAPFGLPLGQTSDSANTVGAVFRAFGAELTDKDGNITVNSDPVKQVLTWYKKLVPFLPPDVFAWDDAGNNKWLISGKGAYIQNPPSAWAVAVRDAPKVAEQCWHFPSAKGPKGRFDPAQPSFWGIWNFSPNKAAAKSLALYLWEKDSVGQLVAASKGYDLPCFSTLRDFSTWAEQGPPKGGLWNYPPRGDVVESVAGWPAPARVANQIFSQATMPKMVAQCTQQGKSIDDAIAWATNELEGFMRI
ncbi:MAG: ABC transporter substrate-binding protein [Alphaproteobacteria bacterium]|nr:ABC transporter substrate-binding protein [Alphaproteobacteria bacterium]